MRAANILCKAVELGWEWNDSLDEPFYNIELGRLVEETSAFLLEKALYGQVHFDEAECQLTTDPARGKAFYTIEWNDGYGYIQRGIFHNSDITLQLSAPSGTRIYHTTAVDSRGTVVRLYHTVK